MHVVGVDDRPGVVAELFGKIAEKNISVDMIIQNVTTDADPRAAITFTLGKTDLARAKPWIETVAKGVGAREVRYDEDIVKVSIVGLGMRSHAGIAAKMFRILAERGHQHPGDRHERDPGQLPGRREVHRARRARAARRLRPEQGLKLRGGAGTHECIEQT